MDPTIPSALINGSATITAALITIKYAAKRQSPTPVVVEVSVPKQWLPAPWSQPEPAPDPVWSVGQAEGIVTLSGPAREEPLGEPRGETAELGSQRLAEDAPLPLVPLPKFYEGLAGHELIATFYGDVMINLKRGDEFILCVEGKGE